MDTASPDPLAMIRARIDEIDAQMHELLIERSGVVAELIRVKGASKPGGAFRPVREADMMRRLVMRHRGALPLASVEHIWREIITTFTAMQAPFGVLAAPADDPAALRDAIRFAFGFSVPVTDCGSAEEAIGRVAASAQDIAVIPLTTDGRWWQALEPADAPKIFARVPFIEMPTASIVGPAALPAYVVGPPLRDAAAFDVIVAADAEGGLAETPVAAWRDGSKLRTVGGFAQPIRIVGPRRG